VRRFRFIDEAGINLAMTRLYGRAPRGERVRESVPRNYGAQTSLISSLSLAGVEATMSIEGAVDTEVFDAYVERVLGPTIRAGDVVVLDNLTAHRSSRIEEVAAECRHWRRLYIYRVAAPLAWPLYDIKFPFAFLIYPLLELLASITHICPYQLHPITNSFRDRQD
jgi:hypothetical protein